jgi:nucleoside-diphosphate-sugar epimerase
MEPEVFDETCWSDIEHAKFSAYVSSKTLAEQCAWKHAKDSEIELVTLCPGLVLGESLISTANSSTELVATMLNGKFKSLI